MAEIDKVEEVAVVEEAPKPAKKTAVKKAEPAPEPTPEIIWFESREKEPSMFDVAGVKSIRNFSTGRLEWRVKAEDVERFKKNHFVMNGRVRPKV